MTDELFPDELSPADPGSAGSLLRPHGDPSRGFLGTDHVTQNDHEIGRVLTEGGATVLVSTSGAVLAFAPTAENPRQAVVAVVGATPAQLDQLLRWAYSSLRATSWIAEADPESEEIKVYTESGFVRSALLRGDRYRSREYRDTVLLYAQKPHQPVA